MNRREEIRAKKEDDKPPHVDGAEDHKYHLRLDRQGSGTPARKGNFRQPQMVNREDVKLTKQF